MGRHLPRLAPAQLRRQADACGEPPDLCRYPLRRRVSAFQPRRRRHGARSHGAPHRSQQHVPAHHLHALRDGGHRHRRRHAQGARRARHPGQAERAARLVVRHDAVTGADRIAARRDRPDHSPGAARRPAASEIAGPASLARFRAAVAPTLIEACVPRRRGFPLRRQRPYKPASGGQSDAVADRRETSMHFIRWVTICAAWAILSVPPVVAQDHRGMGDRPTPGASPYAGMETRPVKALSDQQIADMKAGRGMGLALAAELNGYPGPAHVLELADALMLSDKQRAATNALLAEMKAETIPIGERIIADETALDRLFSERRVTTASLDA